MKRLVIGLMCAAAVVAGAANANAQQRIKASMVMSAESLQQITVHIARAHGFFAAEGLDMDFPTMSSGTAMAAAVIGGSVDLTSGGLIQVIRSVNEGADVVAFAMNYEALPINIVLSNEAIARTGIQLNMPIDEKVRRLKGTNIAISGPGTSTDQFARSLFLARGINPDGFITLQPIGDGAASLAAFQRKLVDGFSNTAPWVELAEGQNLGKAVIDPFKGEVPELKDVPYQVVYTSRKTLQAKPEMVKAVVRALSRSLKLAQEQPTEVRKIRQFLPSVPEEAFNTVVEKYRTGMPKSPVITQQHFDKTLVWMNIGVANPIKSTFEKVAVTEPTRSAAAEILK